MTAPGAPSAELATFDRALAHAVVEVLTAAGMPAVAHDAEAGQTRVLVPVGRRDEALALLAARMERVHEAVAEAAGDRAAATPAWPAPVGEPAPHTDDEHARPLVLERFRSLGWVAVALVPLLVIALARVPLSTASVLVLLVGTAVALSAWRSGRFGGRD